MFSSMYIFFNLVSLFFIHYQIFFTDDMKYIFIISHIQTDLNMDSMCQNGNYLILDTVFKNVFRRDMPFTLAVCLMFMHAVGDIWIAVTQFTSPPSYPLHATFMNMTHRQLLLTLYLILWLEAAEEGESKAKAAAGVGLRNSVCTWESRTKVRSHGPTWSITCTIWACWTSADATATSLK